VKLGIVYHMPFWQTPDGGIWEIEGSFARYVDSLAPYADEVSLCVPVRPAASVPAEGTRVRAANVRLAPLPYFDGPRQFYPQLFAIRRILREWVRTVDLINCRVPTPAAWFAFKEARRAGVPVFLLVVGDLEAVAPTLPYRGVKRWLYAAYTAFEERAIRRMARASLTFANGADLAEKHRRQGATVIETKTTTIAAGEINTRADTCQGAPIRLLTVSRIDPRKGLTSLPDAIARLRAAGHDVSLDIVGPAVGQTGEHERAAIEGAARDLGVADRVRCTGPVPLDRLMPLYRDYDLFVLPTGPGEGIPRVLLEAMAGGLPVIATRIAGIPSLVTHEQNGLLMDRASGAAVAEAAGRLIADPGLRQRLIRNGYETARAHTLEQQAAAMAKIVAAQTGAALRQPAAVDRPRGLTTVA
jgi:glycosyltransferase involved in cell wall biosynthesis